MSNTRQSSYVHIEAPAEWRVQATNTYLAITLNNGEVTMFFPDGQDGLDIINGLIKAAQFCRRIRKLQLEKGE